MVTEPDFGKRVELTAYAVGKRKNIRTKIGAVVMLNDEKLLKRFCIPYYDVLDGEPPSPTWGEADAQNYAMTMVCMPQSFEKWGLPDQLYTEVDFDLNKNADLRHLENARGYLTIPRMRFIKECSRISGIRCFYATS